MRAPSCVILALSATIATSSAPPVVAQEPDVPTVIRNATVIPMTGAPPLAHATVLIRGDRIAAVGPAADIAVPAGARVIDGSGRYPIPGLIEMHAHVSKARASALGLFIANGVTTIRDVGSEHAEAVRWRREIRAGERLGPRMLIAGPYLEAASNIERMRRDPPEARIEPFERARIPIGSPEDAVRVVDSLAALELDFFKIRTVQDRETYLALNRAADKHGLKVVGHVSGLSPELVLEAGQDGIDHFFYPLLDSLPVEQRMAFWREFARRGVPIVPTLVVFTESVLAPSAQLRAMLADSLGRADPRRPYVSRFMLLDWQEQMLGHEEDEGARPQLEAAFRSITRDLREMHAAGMQILAGSDVAVLGIFPGWALHEELEALVEHVGLTPAEALERATRLPARFLAIADSVGTVEPGKVADLVVLDADPLADVRNTRRIAAVVVRGRVFGRPDIEEILAAVRRAPDLRANDWLR